MKKYFFLSLLFFTSGVSYAQIPSGTPVKTQLPIPKIRPLTPADLQVTDIHLVSCTKEDAAKKLLITVSVTIKNNGQTRAGNSGLKSFFQSPSGTATSRPVDGTAPVAAIDPGASITANYIFRRPFSGDAGFTLVRFDFWVKADANNVVRESDEANNGSASIQITPPAH